MTYLALEKILEARTYIEENIKKPDTFMGLVLFLLCVVERKRNGSYLKSDMKQFSEFADNAFYLSDTLTSYSDKYWFALLTNDWVFQVKDYFLKGNKVSASKVMQSLFWLNSFNELQSKMSSIPSDIFDDLFINDLTEADFTQTKHARKADFLSKCGGTSDALTIKFDGSFVKKKAGDLSGAPFGQTLYAGTEIKKIISVFDFDFIEKFDLSGTSETYNISTLSSEIYLSKPFLLLAGISGTGKTRFVRKQAQYSGDGKTNFELVSVRPDWHEPSDLLGYISRLNSDGAEYVVTNVLKFMVKAWLNIIENVDADSWTQKPFSQISPFWLCLDEMNLAPVEQYFADYLSVIETREWKDGEYSCDPLLKKDVFEQLKEPALTKLQQDLGLKDHDDLWKYFINQGVAIPFNLIVAGTVNMDETTHGFSRKVIDRALSFDFGEFFPNAVEEFFDETLKPKALSYPLFSHAKFEQFETVAADSDAVKTKAFFNTINSVLKDTPFELAYRAFNELCLAVISFAPKNDIELAAVFDDFLMCKVLPRIEGDDDKLVGNSEQNLLEQLETVLADKLANIWQGTRPDLLREVIEQPDETVMVACRSAAKLVRMRKLLESGFTSFWP